MPRYIEADELRCRVKEKTNPYGKPTLDYESGVKVLNMIDNTSTADVVPKSEVDKWYHEYHAIKDELKQEKMYHRETEKLVDKYCTELEKANAEIERLKYNLKAVLDEIPETKRELASEIFAEIEFDICQLDFDREETRAIAIEGIIAKAKKKYTEGTK